MKAFLSIVLTALLLTGCSSGLPLHQSRPDDLTYQPLNFEFPVVDQQETAHGLKLYMRKNNELPLVDMTIMVEGGSIYDPAGKTGLSSVFAELLKTGGSLTLSPQDLETELESRAITLTVSSSEYCFEIHLSVHRDDFERGLEIVADLLQRPRFDAARLELARTQMLEDIHRKNDDPGTVARRLLAQAVNHDHPFGAFPTEAEIKSFTRDDFIRLHQRFFTPENVWIAVSGDINTALLPALFSQKFSKWLAVPAFVREFPSLPADPSGQILLVDKDIPQTTILMGHKGISKDNPDAMALRVANYILGGGGFNSRLMREVRSNRGLAYSVYSYFQVGRHLPGMFIAGCETKSQSTVEVVSLMRQLMRQMMLEPVSDVELELAKKSLINSFVFAFDNNHSIVSRRMRLDYYAYPETYMATYRQEIAAVTVADIQRVAKQYLHPDQLQIVLVGDSRQFVTQLEEIGLPVTKINLDEN